MNLTDVIGPDAVILGLRAGTKPQLLGELARQAATRLKLPPDSILAPLTAREKLGSTGLGRGFALPHARVEGLDRLFTDAGFAWREAGCSMCVAANGERVPPGQRSVSTSNRNFVGRQGPGARTHLASPAMAAAAALKGALTDVRSL